jgi:hypothetical protein
MAALEAAGRQIRSSVTRRLQLRRFRSDQRNSCLFAWSGPLGPDSSEGPTPLGHDPFKLVAIHETIGAADFLRPEIAATEMLGVVHRGGRAARPTEDDNREQMPGAGGAIERLAVFVARPVAGRDLNRTPTRSPLANDRRP